MISSEDYISEDLYSLLSDALSHYAEINGWGIFIKPPGDEEGYPQIGLYISSEGRTDSYGTNIVSRLFFPHITQ